MKSLLLCIFLAFPCFFSYAQVDSLTIIFNDVSINSSTVYRDLHAGFPNPVLSLITVKDQDGRYVHGLADTTRWIGSTDTTELGLPVDDVWKIILEYHEEDFAKPENPDVKQVTPPFQVTELYDVEGFGLTMSLVMDYSGSMKDDVYIAEDAARVFVRKMTPNDQAAIIKFTGKVQIVQEFTSDTTMLMEAISKPTGDREHTALFNAVYTGVNLCLEQGGRRAVVAYTDGRDNYSSHSIHDLIQFAKQNSIPIFMIGLGDGVRHDELEHIAEETGGVYLYAPTVEDLASVYISIYGLIRGYYVMAHTSPDPFMNDTWRLVDLTLEHGNIKGKGIGRYYVPFKPSDLVVSKEVQTDSVFISMGDTIYVATAGATINYRISITNNGPAIAGDVRVVDLIADSLQFLQYDVIPDTITQDSLIWNVQSIYAGETISFEYESSVDTLKTQEILVLVNLVRATCSSDIATGNNIDSAVVYYTPLLPADIFVTKQGIGDSLVVSYGDSTWYVYPGDTVEYHVSVINRGEHDAYQVVVQDILPEEVTFLRFQEEPFTLSGDTLTWSIPQLNANGGRENFIYSCRVDTFMPPWNVPLVNLLTATCIEDFSPENSTVQDTVWCIGTSPPDPLIRVSPLVVDPGDSVQVEVMTPVNVQEWDLEVIFKDGSVNNTYGDLFIENNTLIPGVWTEVMPDFAETYMTTGQEQERVAVIFLTTDVWSVIRSDTAYFTIQSSDEFYLDENLFRISLGIHLGMRFRLNSNKWADITIYDISGGFVRNVIAGPYRSGWNYTSWDGNNENGSPVGTGTYVAIFSSGDFKKVRKLILIR
jgi:VWFA-related protein